jgi:D-sedoheptulose 7-phosphate isomerase
MTDRWQTFLQSEVERHRRTLDALDGAVAAPFAALVEACLASLRAGGKILLFGNGGSAADAQHLATELAVRYRKDRPAMAALALTTDTSVLTAVGNDFGFERLFARQVEAVGRAGDVAIGISTSGNSANVVAGLQAAENMDLVPAALAGNGGGKLVGLADPLIVVPSDETARIQEMHILLGHALCQALELELG